MDGMGFSDCIWEAWGGTVDEDGRVDTFQKSPRRVDGVFEYFNPGRHGEARYSNLTVRTRPLSWSSMSCTTCRDEPAHDIFTLECHHGPVGRRCYTDIQEGKRKCQLCTLPPKYMLLQAMAEPQRASSNTCNDQSPRDALLEDLDDWVTNMQDDSDSSD